VPAELGQVLRHIDEHIQSYVAQLKNLVRIPSISTGGGEDPASSMDRAADFLAEEFQHLGLAVQKIQVRAGSNPLVLAHRPPPSPEQPTLLIYGHYDVQGVDNPRSAWECDPFAAIEQDGYLIGRGASDDKGPLFAHIKAVDAILNSGHEPPGGILFLIEGEEECGSGTLADYLARGGLAQFGPITCTVISDTSMYGPEQPSLSLGLRGIVFTEITICGPHQEVHSGLFGGILPNPNHLLIQALAGLIDPDGRIVIPGFYDQVRALSRREKILYAALPVNEASYCQTLGVPHLAGEPDCSILERRWTRPTLDIHYLNGGSPRTIIPSRSTAALSCRLVPDQDPEQIKTALHQFIRSRLPAGTRVEFSRTHTCPAYHLDPDHPLVIPALSAIHTGFGIKPLLTREGGSIPIVADLDKHTGAPILLIGLGQISDNWHGPNERFSLRDFHRGIRTAAALHYELARR